MPYIHRTVDHVAIIEMKLNVLYPIIFVSNIFSNSSQFSIDSEMYTKSAAVLKDDDVTKQVKLAIWRSFWLK